MSKSKRYGESVVASMFHAISEVDSLVFYREWLSRQDVIDRFYLDELTDFGKMLDEKELPVNYMLELRDCELPLVDVIKPSKPWYRQGEKSW